ncbi:MAG: DUF4870 domain-containing protein [Microcoleaceae cyanobacterium]
MDQDQRKILSVLSHGAIFFGATIVSVGIPIAMLFLAHDSIVKENAKESLNFHINLYIYGLIFSLLTFVVIGFPLLALLWIVSIIMPIIAIIAIANNPEQPYRYPFIFRVV